MFLNILELRIRKNKKKIRENCLENVVSDLLEENVHVSTKVLLEKSLKTNKQKLKTKTHKNIHNLCQLLGTKVVLFVSFCDTIFKTVSPKF